MDQKKIRLSKSCNLYLQKDKKYKNIGIEIVFKTKFKYENITAYRMLSKILSNSNYKYPNIESMSRKKDVLYDLEMGFSHNYSANLCLYKAFCNYVNPKYIKDKNYQKEVIEFLHDMIYCPNIIDGHFDDVLFDISKNLVESEIKTEKDSINSHAIIEVLRRLGNKKQAISASTIGDLKVLNELNSTNLVEYYKNIINSGFDIYVIGDIKFSKISKMIKEYFAKENNAQQKIYKAAKVINKNIIKPKTIFKNVNQARVAIIYHTPYIFNDEKSYAMRLLGYILGGGSQSKLFTEIREKQGLCYAIGATYNTSYGYILVNTGVGINMVDKVIGEINKQIDSIKNGQFNEMDIKRAYDYFESALIKQKDDIFSNIDLKVRYNSFNMNITLEEIINKYKQVTKEDIVNVAKNISYKTHVVITNKGNNYEN